MRTNKHLQLKECNTVLVHNGIFCKLCARNCFEDDFIKNAVSSGKGRLIRIIFFDYFNGVKRFCEFLRFFVHQVYGLIKIICQFMLQLFLRRYYTIQYFVIYLQTEND